MNSELEPRAKLAQKIYDPIQVFYSLNASTDAKPSVKYESAWLAEKLVKAGVYGSVRYSIVPRSKNLLDIRLQNLADPFDQVAKTTKVDLKELAEALYFDVNPASKNMPKLWFKELSMTGNMALDEMRARKITWKTVDDHKLKSKMDFGGDESYVTLEP